MSQDHWTGQYSEVKPERHWTVATVWCECVLIYYPVKHQSNVTLFALLSSSNKLLPANGQQQEVPRRETVGYIIQSY